MRIVTLLFVATIGLSIAGAAHAQGTGRGLDIQPGARQNGLGAAGVALGGDATGVTWWNPAALGFIEKGAIELTFAQLVPGLASDVTYNYATFVQPVKGWGAFGLGIVFLSYGESEGTDQAGNSTGSFGSNEFSPALYYGTRILNDLTLGAALKWVRIQLAPDSQSGVGTTFGLDIGAMYRIPVYNLNLGMNVQNLGPSVTFINEDQASPLSRNLKVGAAWEAWTSQEIALLAVYDFNQSLVTNDFRTYNYGAEIRAFEQVAARVGYYKDPLGDIGGYTFGLGVGWGALNIDFGSIPQASNSGLDNVQKITLGYSF